MMREIHKKNVSDDGSISDENGNANLALFADLATRDYIVLQLCVVKHELLCTMCRDLHNFRDAAAFLRRLNVDNAKREHKYDLTVDLLQR